MDDGAGEKKAVEDVLGNEAITEVYRSFFLFNVYPFGESQTANIPEEESRSLVAGYQMSSHHEWIKNRLSRVGLPGLLFGEAAPMIH